MAKNLKDEYLRHVSNTSPDMDKLWEKIEEKIDSSETCGRKIAIKVSKKSHRKLAAAAASLAIIFTGAVIWIQYDKAEFTKKNYADNNSDAKNYENHFKYDIGSYDKNSVISYNQLSFNETATPNYEPSYKVTDDAYFVSSKVLEETEFFADVTVEKAKLGNRSGTYILKVHRLISKDGDVRETSIKLESSAPYILQENRSYFIPLKKTDEKYSIVFENAPQIEITLNGEIVYPNCWDLGDNYSQVTIAQKSIDDFYYDRMRISDEDILENLILQWQEL